MNITSSKIFDRMIWLSAASWAGWGLKDEIDFWNSDSNYAQSAGKSDFSLFLFAYMEKKQ